MDRRVNPRASRMADMVASVPLLLTRPHLLHGLDAGDDLLGQLHLAWPGVPKTYRGRDGLPDVAADDARGDECPRIIGPQEHTRSDVLAARRRR
ncbi:hypothetical protein GCM10017687_03820 [Streptomyces echinatus]